MFISALYVSKILGVTVNSDLKWDYHVAVITSKAGKRLWFMKQLRKAGVTQDDLMFYYQSVVRPVLEYASPCWHLNLTKEQTKQLEDVQRRALQVIFGNIRMTKCVAHITFRHLLNVDLTLAEHFSRGSSETTGIPLVSPASQP